MKIKTLGWLLGRLGVIRNETVDAANSKGRIAETIEEGIKICAINFPADAPISQGQTVIYKSKLYTALFDMPIGSAPDNELYKTKWEPLFISTYQNIAKGGEKLVTANAVAELKEYFDKKPPASWGQADETTKGVARIADQTDIQEGTSKSTIVTPFWLKASIDRVLNFFGSLTWFDVLTSEVGANVVDVDVQVKSLSTPIFDGKTSFDSIAVWVYRLDDKGLYATRELVEVSLQIFATMLKGVDPTNPTNPSVRNFEVVEIYKRVADSLPPAPKGFEVVDVIKRVADKIEVTILSKYLELLDEMEEGNSTVARLRYNMSDGTSQYPTEGVSYYSNHYGYGVTVDRVSGLLTVPLSGYGGYNIFISAYDNGKTNDTPFPDASKPILIRKAPVVVIGELENPDYTKKRIIGYMYVKAQPKAVQEVDLYEGSTLLFQTTTGDLRTDIADKLNNQDIKSCGFHFDVPESHVLNDGKAHSITAKERQTGIVIGVQTYQLKDALPANDTIEYVQFRFVPNGFGVGRGDLLEIQQRDGYAKNSIGINVRLSSSPESDKGLITYLRAGDDAVSGSSVPRSVNRTHTLASGQNLKSKSYSMDIYKMENDNGRYYPSGKLLTVSFTTGTVAIPSGNDGTAKFVKIYPQ